MRFGHALRNALMPGYRLRSILQPGTRLALLLKENQCHEPAGSPEGGQFCSSGDSGSGGSEKTSKAEADKIYGEKLHAALATLQSKSSSAQSPAERDKAIVEFKTARAEAQSQWKASQAGTKPAPVPEQKVFQADRNLVTNLAGGKDPTSAYQQWRQDTSAEKAGKLVSQEKTEPPAQPKTVAPPPPPTTPPPVVHTGPANLEQVKATLAAHLAAGKPVTAAIRATATAHPNADMKMMVAAGLHHGLNASTIRIQTNTARGRPWEQKKTEQAKIGTNEINAGSFSKDPSTQGKFYNDNQKLNNLIENSWNGGAQALKDKVSNDLAQRLAGHPDWDKAAKAFSDKLSAQGGLDKFGQQGGKALASRIIGNWAGTSGDTDDMARAMQLAARDEFEMKDAKLEHMHIDSKEIEDKIWNAAAKQIGFPEASGLSNKVSAEDLATFKSAMRAYTRQEYENTQAWFKERGITEISVFRGMKQNMGGDPKVVTLQGQPLSSFSSNLNTSRGFGSRLYMATFPVSHVVASTHTGRGCLGEREIVVIGHPIKTVRAATSYFTTYGSIDAVGRKAFGVTPG